MKELTIRILDMLERQLPTGVVQVIIGLAFWIGTVLVLAYRMGIYGVIAAGLLFVVGGVAPL